MLPWLSSRPSPLSRPSDSARHSRRDSPATRTALRSWRSRRRWRQLAATALLLVAVVLAVRERAATTTVLATTTNLPVGHVFTATDLREVGIPAAVAGPAYPSHVDDVIGRVSQSPFLAGELVTDSRLVTTAETTAPDRRVVSLPITDLGTLALLHTGSVVDVLVAPEPTADARASAETVAQAVSVVDVPRNNRSEPLGTVAVVAPPEVATTLAGLALHSPLTLAIVK